MSGRDVRGIDAAVGADEAVARARDDHAALHAHDGRRLAQHDLDLARIAVPALGEGDRLRARRDRAQVDDRALGLGDDLLGHDEHVAAGRCQLRFVGHRESPGRRDEAGQVVARPDLGQRRQRDSEQAMHRC